MKKFLSFGSALVVLAAFSVSSISFNASANSLQELAGTAAYYCKFCGDCTTDCASDATSNIYPHYVATDLPTVPVIPN